MKESYFSKQLVSGSPIRPFMVAGVLEKDYTGPRNGSAMRAFLEDALTEASGELRGKRFVEYDSFTICSIEGRWAINTAISPRYAAGRYFVMEKLGLMPIYLEMHSAHEQTVSIKIKAGRFLVMLNDEIVYNNSDVYDRRPVRRYVFEHNVTALGEIVSINLMSGKNVLCMLTGQVGRSTGIQFSMELLSQSDLLFAVVPLNVPEDVRSEIFESQRKTRMEDDSYLIGEVPVLRIGAMPLKHSRVSVVLGAEKASTSRSLPKNVFAPSSIPIDVDTSYAKEGEVTLPAINVAGQYKLTVTWNLPDGTAMGESIYNFSVSEALTPIPGYDRFEERRKLAIERLAEKGNALALFRLERYTEICEEIVDAFCRRIEQRADCADFDLLPLLWLVWEDHQLTEPKLSAYIHARIREAATGFRYWVDEPESSSMFYCSENHRIGFHVCEYLAGLLYPTCFFSCAQQNGMYHSLKGRMHLAEWLNQRCRVGFDEPHSDSYLPVTMSALLVLREVLPVEEYPLRNMVNTLLDFLTYIYAVSSFDGVMATPRGRSYNKPLRTRMFSTICGSFWIMFGNAPANPLHLNQELAFSPYVPPRGICMLADNFTPATFTFKEGIMHFDKHNADFTIRRTPDYMIGGVRDHNVGMCDMHFVPAMVALRNDITVFFSAPQNTAEGSGLRPDYWAGQAFLPRVLMAKRTIAVIWHGVDNSDIWMTHCHFNARKFDEVVVHEYWTFGRSGNGYVGIYSSVPHSFREEGPYAGRELICDGNEVVWIAECGSANEDGSFELFVQKLVHSEIGMNNDLFRFNSPGSGILAFGLVDGFTVDGNDVPIPNALVSSPWLRSRYGSGKFEYNCPQFINTQWSYPTNE